MSKGVKYLGTDWTPIAPWAGVVAAVGLLVAVRLVPFPSVFRGGDVVLLSNDPYAYLHLVEHIVGQGDLTSSISDSEPLFVWTLAVLSSLLGGVDVVPFVLAWYPVVSALCTGLLVFDLGRTVTGDVRVGIVAVVVLAVTPLHASRTALGFADHHAFDYLWLALTLAVLARLAVRSGAAGRRRWAEGAVLGVAVAGQTLAWEASPILLVPAAGAVGVCSLVFVRDGDPARALTPIVAGFGLAAVLVVVAHWTLGWHSTVVAAAPISLFLGGIALLVLAEGVARAGRSWPTVLAMQAAVLGLVAPLAWLVVPELFGDVVGRIRDVGEYFRAYAGTGIGETASITGAFGPVAGPLVLLGFAPFLGLPAAAWGVVRGWRRREPGWLVLGVYVAWFLGLAFLQRRFAAQLAVPLAVFAGFGFVALANWLALVRPPMPLREDPVEPERQTLELPGRRRVALLGGLGVVGIGSGSLFSSVILSRVSIDPTITRAAAWMGEHADERGWTYPRNYVLAQWDNVRVYNYFVSGESRSYQYARANYLDFTRSPDADEWYDRFEGRVGFVVTRSGVGVGPTSLGAHAQLHDRYGSAGRATDGVGHYRAVWESADGSAKVFAVVPGATVTGEAEPDSVVALETSASLAGSATTITYQRRVGTDERGRFSVVVAHPGEYAVELANETATVDVPESAVLDGAELAVGRR